MKRNIVLLCLCMLVANAFLFGDDDSVGKMDKAVNDFGYRFVSGFDFEKYVGSPVGLNDILNKEVAYAVANSPTQYALVGHSQGGVNVLAFATKLKDQNPSEYKKLKAVITVSGIDKGLKALDGGFAPFLSRLNTDVNTFYKGYIGLSHSCIVASGVSNIMNKYIRDNKTEIINDIEGCAPCLNNYIKTAVKGGTYSELAEIYDMMPKSNFINKYVSETKNVRYKVQTGTRTNYSLAYRKFWGIKIYYLVRQKIPVYSTYTAYLDVPKFSNDLPVGYIVGTNSNTLSMLDSGTEDDIRDGCKTAAVFLRVGQGLNIARACVTLDLFGNSTYASYCANAASWLENIDGQLNELKNSNENDGLVAKESQFYPTKFYNPATGATVAVHTNVLGSDPKGYVEMNYNHKDICPGDNTDVLEEIKKMLTDVK